MSHLTAYLTLALSLPSIAAPNAAPPARHAEDAEYTALKSALQQDDVKAVQQYLPLAGHKLCAPSPRGRSKRTQRQIHGVALRRAAQYDAPQTIAWLVAQGADINDFLWDNYHPKRTLQSAVHTAAACGSLNALAKLAELGANLELPDEDGNTPLMLAAGSGKQSLATISLLLEKGSQPDLRNHKGENAADLAAEHESVQRLLARHGVFPQNAEQATELRAWCGQHVANPLAAAILMRDTAAAEKLLQEGLNPNEPSHTPPLLLAIRCGDVDMVHLLRHYGAAFPQETDADYAKWLYSVVLCGNPDILDIFGYSNNTEPSAFVVAVRGNCSAPMVEAMLEHGANVTHKELLDAFICSSMPSAQTWQLMDIYRHGQQSVAREAFMATNSQQIHGFYCVDYRNAKFNHTQLMIAAKHGTPEECRMLLEAGADARAIDGAGRGVLRWAQSGGKTENLALLEAAGAQWGADVPFPAVGEKLPSAPQLTQEEQQEALAAYLQQVPEALNNADAAFFFRQPKEHINTPLPLAIDTSLLLSAPGAKTESRNQGTALMFAAARGQEDVQRALLARGADVNATTSCGHSAIVFAAAVGHAGCVKLLLHSGSDQHALALQTAAFHGQHAVVDYLLQRGIRPGVAVEYALMSDNPHPGLIAHRTPSPDFALELLLRHKDSPKHVQKLLSMGASVNRPGFYPLHLVLQHNTPNTDTLKILLQAGADVTRKNEEGLTPMEFLLHRNVNISEAARLLQEATEKRVSCAP